MLGYRGGEGKGRAVERQGYYASCKVQQKQLPRVRTRLGSKFGGYGTLLGWDYNKNFDICHHIFIQIGVGILSRFEATGY
jgi:hypothetical protein